MSFRTNPYLRALAIATVFGIAACLEDPQDDAPVVIVPDSVSGTWKWSVTPLTCEVIAGILDTQHDVQMTKEGDRISANFIDGAGNAVSITGPFTNGVWDATIRVEDGEGRTITASMQLTLDELDLEDVLDGPISITSDSSDLCPAGAEATVRISRERNPDEEEVFGQCGAVDIVIAMDTSGSMDDEAEALCTQINRVVGRMQARGLQGARAFKWGIIQDKNDPEFASTGQFSCLDDHIQRVFSDPVVPGTEDDRLTTVELEGDEDWADAVSIVAHLGSGDRNPGFQWRTDAVKIIVPISDEGPSQGDPSDEPDDAAAIDNAIAQANANQVIVSPLIANDAEPTTAELGRRLGEQTSGRAFRTTDPGLDLGELLFDQVFDACGGQLVGPSAPPAAGPTTLVAVDAQGGLYELGNGGQTETKLLDVKFERGGTPLVNVGGMVFNERQKKLWAVAEQVAGTAPINVVAAVGPDGQATRVAEDDGDIYQDLAQSRITQAIFSTDDDNDLDIVNNVHGRSSDYADDMGTFAETGNALTFIAEDLYLASGQTLWWIDSFSGRPTVAAALSVVDAPAGLEAFIVVSMTARPGDNRVFALVAQSAAPGAPTWIAILDPASGQITLVAQTSIAMDGLAWVPVNYFR